MYREPPTKLAIDGFDVVPTDDVEIRWQRTAGRVEKTSVHRVRIRTSDQTKRGDMMCGHHARIARVELIGPPVTPELRRDLVDSLGNDQYWPIGGLRQKVSHRTVETSRQCDPLPILSNESKRAVDAQYSIDVTSEQPAPSFRFVDRPESLGLWGDQIDDPGNR